jgi:hypothetical protein
MWQAWQLSKAYTCRPSELYGIEHPVQKLFFDRAVWVFGSTLEADLEESGKSRGKKPKSEKQTNAARMKVLALWLGAEAAGFRTPMPTRRET